MKTIGLIGGTGWVSSIDYYRFINQEINRRLGGQQAARCILWSFNFGEIDVLVNQNNDLESVYKMVCQASKKLETCGADCILLCANTLHIYAARLKEEINIPVIHIGEATAKEIKKAGLKKVAVLGTKFTMEMDFYRSKLNESDIEMIIPEKEDRIFIHNSILNELLKDILKPETKARFLEIINGLIGKGAEGIVLGCTEIPLLIKQEDVPVPVFDTTLIHAKAAVDFALGN
ncbi:MAG: aspartate/glutamate racemase family protein [Bacteroidales bacterium]|jgi:aspartate racemase